MVLTFKVDGQTLRKLPSAQTPRQGSCDYLRLQFVFSGDWDGLQRVLYLQSGEVSTPIELTEDTVSVPPYFTQQGQFFVTLLGLSGATRVPTNVAAVTLEPSNELWEAEVPLPRPGWVEELMALNSHPPIPSEEGTWLLWDSEAECYRNSGLSSRGPQGEPGPVGPRGEDGLPGLITVAGTDLTLMLPNGTDVQCTDTLTALTVSGFTPPLQHKTGLWSILFRAEDGISVTLPDSIRWAAAEPDFVGGKEYWLLFISAGDGQLGVWAVA